ncbi:serine/threonine-protein kinase [Cellulomonas sp. NS3]|uniref:serine/threonine-protein kinase n=1 Tax=Cellulomonas sp. NS3 TaxID=2973977 RepID=UPI0021638435|nr:serine/threonine protein kinase [Cellulomonas sp. NS3]
MGAAPDLDTGVVLADRYRLDEVLGRGGMATVHRAHDLVLGRDVAVKLFPPVAEGAEELQRHKAEMRVLARLDHPGLVTLHDAGSVPAGGPLRQTYLVMELVPGRTLADRLLVGALPPAHVAHLGRQVAEALVVVHAADVVHRDIKPANVLLAGAGDRAGGGLAPAGDEGRGAGELRAKLADFGIARLSDGARLTVTGTTLGTASYLSPEQATGSAVGPASDVYSLGLVLLECLTGERAFTGTALEAATARLLSSPAVPGRFGAAWSDLLSEMTARDPDDRPPAAEVAVRLAVLAEEPAGTGAAPAPTVASPVAASPTGASPVSPAPSVGSPVAPSATASSPVVPSPTVGSPVVPSPRPTGPGSTAVLPVATGPGGAVPTDPVAAQPGADDPAAGSHGSTPSPSTSSAPSATGARPARPSAPVTVGGTAPARDGDRRARRGTRLAAVALLLCAGGATVLATQASGDAPPVPPSYPVVEGALGDALADLQRSVQP